VPKPKFDMVPIMVKIHLRFVEGAFSSQTPE